MVTTFEEQNRLGAGDAVAAVIQLEDGRYLLQHRDDIPDIWYPAHWGCFGGAVNDGEDPAQALTRELFEELEFQPPEFFYFTRFDFDLAPMGLRSYYRIYYVIHMTNRESERLVLHEGDKVEAFRSEEIFKNLTVTPYDAFALFLYHHQARIG